MIFDRIRRIGRLKEVARHEEVVRTNRLRTLRVRICVRSGPRTPGGPITRLVSHQRVDKPPSSWLRTCDSQSVGRFGAPSVPSCEAPGSQERRQQKLRQRESKLRSLTICGTLRKLCEGGQVGREICNCWGKSGARVCTKNCCDGHDCCAMRTVLACSLICYHRVFIGIKAKSSRQYDYEE